MSTTTTREVTAITRRRRKLGTTHPATTTIIRHRRILITTRTLKPLPTRVWISLPPTTLMRAMPTGQRTTTPTRIMTRVRMPDTASRCSATGSG